MEEDWHLPWHLQIAHIASGQGRARRVDDIRAVILLCARCHQTHVSDACRHHEMVINGKSYPTIDERHTLWIKKNMDAENYDIGFLDSLWIGHPPAPERPPEAWMEKMHQNQGLYL